ncbi:hypothetical protein GDO78_022921 [Eleutherodactylus coqui]|uniref:Uncharacterized protein n=1 Tax=Eleutherodactylus coqui TaxID=57060 RepID=A0A8J6B7S3_ELECQ|nr:hypothetical protein GDO78_022921 [Eleutherodactylus coqui]
MYPRNTRLTGPIHFRSSTAMTSQETKDRTVSVTSDNSNCNTLPAANPTSPLSRDSLLFTAIQTLWEGA